MTRLSARAWGLFAVVCAACCLLTLSQTATETLSPAASAINALGIDLLRQPGPRAANTVLSPYAIQTGLAMLYGGADGLTREEMRQALHYPEDEAALHASFLELRGMFAEMLQRGEQEAPPVPGAADRVELGTLVVANRLFGQEGFAWKEPYQAFARTNYAAELEFLDFRKDPMVATRRINDWVETQTRHRIREMVSASHDLKDAGLVLVNTIYLKACWDEPFHPSETQPDTFILEDGQGIRVPMMTQTLKLPYAEAVQWKAVALPYHKNQLVFLVFVPKLRYDLKSVEAALSPEIIGGLGEWQTRPVTLHLPRFKLEPRGLSVGEMLQQRGMKCAFDMGAGKPGFDRIASAGPEAKLHLNRLLHKTFLNLDEKGTEAAAAAESTLRFMMGLPPRDPIHVRVDHPFVFAIVHESSGACLFLGRVSDPR